MKYSPASEMIIPNVEERIRQRFPLVDRLRPGIIIPKHSIATPSNDTTDCPCKEDSVYLLKDKNDEVLRIGHTKRCLSERVKEYKNEPYYSDINIIACICTSKENTKEVERELIEFYCPPFNVKGTNECRNRSIEKL